MKKRILSILIAVCILLTMLPITAMADAQAERSRQKILNDNWPYGKKMTGMIVTLTVAVSDPSSATYQWQMKNGNTFENMAGQTAKDLILFMPASGSTYRCVVDGTLISEAITVVAPNSTWTKPNETYYITNGTVAYMVNDNIFDVVGLYRKGTKDYMINTSYGKKWDMFSSSKATPSASSVTAASAILDDLWVAFDAADPDAIYFRADLAADQRAFAFGCDADLADGLITYDDSAVLNATVKSGVLQYIAMIGAPSAATAQESDASFVIVPAADTPASRFWLGKYDERQIYAYNKTTGTGYKTTNINGTYVTTSVEGVDSGLTLSWFNVPSGGVVSFGYRVGEVADTGATAPVQNATVTFHANGHGTAPAAKTVSVGTAIAAPTAPTATGYTFGGWYTDAACTNAWNFSKAVSANMVLYAKWTVNNYTVQWIVDGEETTETYAYGAAITAPADPEKIGHTFAGWGASIPSAMPAKNLTFTAQWTVNNYTVQWIVDGEETTETYAYGAAITAPADPEKIGHTFAGWGAAIPSTMPAEDLTFTAQWTVNNYTVKWIADGEETTETYAYGAAITVPSDPEKIGHTFAGWGAAIPTTMPAEDLTFTAQWTVNNYTVKWIADGEETTETYAYGAAITVPADPEKIGHTFTGWDAEIPAVMPAEDLTFTAQWTPNVYNITYNAKPGAIRGEYPTTYTYGVPQTLPTDVNRFGYLFCGWRNAEGELLTEIAAGTIGDVALTADWGDLIALAPTQPDAEGDDCYRGEGCPMNEFSDLDPHAWYHDGIHYALAENLMNGLGDGIFAPDAATSRAMVVTILYRVEGAPAVSGDKVFSDVSPDAWYGAAVSWAAANGIVEGHEDGTFRPNDAITREQMAAILYRYAAYKGEASVEHYGEDFMITFPDKTAVSAYAVEAMNWACAEGLINGMDGILNPRGTATRAQAAAILFRYLTAEK